MSKSKQPKFTTRRVFTHEKESWYADAVKRIGQIDEVNIMMCIYDKRGHNDGCIYEFVAVWLDLGGRPVLRIDVFAESFAAFNDFADLFDALKGLDPETQNMSPAAFCALLESLGIEDETERKRPGHAPMPECPTCHRQLPEETVSEHVDGATKRG